MNDEGVKLKITIDASGIKTSADTFATQVAKGLERAFSKLGLGDIGKGISSGKGIAGAAAIGAAVGSVISSALGMVVDALKDLPVIAAIMKLFKIILMLLLMPLIPVLKPVMLLMAEMAKRMAKSNALANHNPFTMWLNLIPGFGAALLSMEEFGTAIKNIDISKLGINLRDKVLIPIGEFFQTLGKQIWDNFIVPGWNWFKDIGKTIYDTFLEPQFRNLGNFLIKIYNWYVKNLGFIFGAKPQDYISAPTTNNNAQGGQSNVYGPHFFEDLVNGPKSWVSDAIITPNGMVKTDPNDFIIATKNPKGLGGGGVININIDRPMLTGQSDIKELVRQISMEIYKAQRRANSYVSK